jgi:hypothetical protein
MDTNTNNLVVFEDGILVRSYTEPTVIWSGNYSLARQGGPIIEYIQSCLIGTKSIMVIPQCDGNNFANDIIAPYIQRAKELGKTFILGTLAQTGGILDADPYINYLYLPLDDDFFQQGVVPAMGTCPEWSEKNNELMWRGGCSGAGGSQSVRIRFVEKLYRANPQVRLFDGWSEGKNIPKDMFGPRIPPTDLMQTKIFFIIDGNVIASNHMWGFATNSVPVILSDAQCWFTEFAQPGIHYISVNTDLSDLDDKIQWIQTHDAEAEQIAKNAHEFATRVFSSEFQHQYIRDKLDAILIKQQTGGNEVITTKRRIYDCFTFYNELDMLYYRLKLLYDHVDKFVLVEARQTFMGNPKPLHYQDNRGRFHEFEDKIVHVIIDLPITNCTGGEQWTNEKFQRCAIGTQLHTMCLANDDMVIISDLDEIIDPTALAKAMLTKSQCFDLEQDFYYYNLHCKHLTKWNKSKLVTYQEITKNSCEQIRFNTYPILSRAGWHLSYFGDVEFIRNKIREFGHQEYNNDTYNTAERIQNALNQGTDLFGRNYVPMTIINPAVNDYLPPHYATLLQKYVVPI